MKAIFYVLITLFLSSSVLVAQTVTQPPSGGNQKSSVTQHIGALAHVTIKYSSPVAANYWFFTGLVYLHDFDGTASDVKAEYWFVFVEVAS